MMKLLCDQQGRPQYPARLPTAATLLLCAAVVTVGGGCSDEEALCPEHRPILAARASDATHVELTFACPLSPSSAADPASFAITDVGQVPPTQLAISAAQALADDRVRLTTAPQVGLTTYTLELSGLRDAADAEVRATVNFVGAGDVATAPITFRVDDRYNASLKSVTLLASVDPLTGVFSHFTNRIPLSDPDGDHLFEAKLPVAVDPARTVDQQDDRLGPQYVAYTVRAVDEADRPLSQLLPFAVATAQAQQIDVPLLAVPPPPPPEGLVQVRFVVDDRPAQALTAPSLRGSFDADGVFDADFPATVALADPDGDHIWEGSARVRIDPQRVEGGESAESQPYSVYLVEGETPHSARSVDFAVPDETAVEASILMGNPALVPVTFRVDVGSAWLDPDGQSRGVYQGEAVFLTGEFGVAEDAFGQNATDAFSGGENVVLQMVERQDHPGVWQRTLFLPPGRPYGWKVVRCPAGKGCTQLNKMVTSSGRAFPTVMKNLVTELCDAGKTSWTDPNCSGPVVIDPRALDKVDTGSGGVLDYSKASVFVGTGAGAKDQVDPAGTPVATQMFKQEVPDLVVDVKQEALETPVYVIGSWRDVNIAGTPADLLTSGAVIDLTQTDYDAGLIGALPPTYTLPPASKPSPFKMDGALDGSAVLVAGSTGGTMPIYAALSGNHLYLATDDSGEGSDNMILISITPPAGLRPAPWGKAGQVAFAGKTLFLADENDSNFTGWFELGSPSDTLLESLGTDQDPALDLFAPAQNGGVLEGTVDLVATFGGSLPANVYLAVGAWASPDGGALYSAAQTPATKDGNGNIEAAEILKLSLPQLKVTP